MKNKPKTKAEQDTRPLSYYDYIQDGNFIFAYITFQVLIYGALTQSTSPTQFLRLTPI